ncbi:hypothetical protein FQN54_003776 [Arachnomyces sp. PD_36]|nr:hypothetical protein FQN54_003776 [Arachnomyces sp. PD_36]
MEMLGERMENPLLAPDPMLSSNDLLPRRYPRLQPAEGTCTQDSPLLSLPSELIHDILSYVSCVGLAAVACTCRCLNIHAMNDLLWAKRVNSYISYEIHDPSPYDSFYDLYVAHHPFWFLAKNKIWFADAAHTGRLLMTRYDHRTGTIEGYRVVVTLGRRNFIASPRNPEVMIHTFNPTVRLWLDDPLIQLEKPPVSTGRQNARHHNWRGGEIPMRIAEHSQGVFNSFVLSPKATYGETEGKTYEEVPPHRQARLWPPPTIPSDHRIDRHAPDHYLWEHKPLKLSSICESGFRTRRWVQFRSFVPIIEGSPTNGVGESMETFATIKPELYTPTQEKPYQGIWVGDYAGNGCEFLLFTQPDDPVLDTDEDDVDSSSAFAAYDHRRNSSSSSAASSHSQADSTPPKRQRLDAIKLTGDPNVPRGEISFRAKDIGPESALRIADEPMFQGARVVSGEGHVASRNFQNG